jgi:RimJ/RimL family protein N-acetyltransferase
MKLEAEVLETGIVRLEPLEERHAIALKAACDADVEVFERLYPIALFGPHFAPGFARLLEAKRSGASLPFAVMAKGALVGMTSYLAIDPAQASVEIGGTFYGPEARGGLVNPAAKRLLLGHAFAAGCRRVVFRVDALNARSRAAVQKLGARFEGVLRQDRVVWTGRVRDTAIYSILLEEWPGVRAALDARLAAVGSSHT